MSTLQWTASQVRPPLRIGPHSLPFAGSVRLASYKHTTEPYVARARDRADTSAPPVKAVKKSRMRATLVATPEARNIVRAVLRKAPAAPIMSTQEIYSHIHERPQPPAIKLPSNAKQRNLLLKQLAAQRAEIPHPESPIRSLKYLKTVVLEDMSDRDEIEKVTVRRVGWDENHRPIGMANTCAGELPLPPEVCEPELLTKKIAWMWRYKAAVDNLNRDEPELPIAEQPHEPFITVDSDTEIRSKETPSAKLKIKPWEQLKKSRKRHGTEKRSYGLR